VCQHTQLLDLDAPQGRPAQRDLTILLHLGSEVRRRWPEGVVHAEDAAYRFVARLLVPASEQGEARGPRRQARECLAVDLACGFMPSQIDCALTLTEWKRWLAWSPASCRAPGCITWASG